jgi:23S rRNA (adenine1618-N6)-methyltransferase
VLHEEKKLHPNNIHNRGYDFPALIQSCPDLKEYVKNNKYGNESIDFANAAAVKALNSALLKHHYGIMAWTLPEGSLCPPIPGRVDYIHYVADLLKVSNADKGKPIKLLDVGTGANGIYALLACQVYGWQCTATDINPLALDNVASISHQNPSIEALLSLRLQQNKSHIFKDVMQADDYFDVSVCNPPFYASLAEALSTNQKKRDNLAQNRHKKTTHKTRHDAKALNFGGQGEELWCEGGESAFLQTMMNESKDFSQQCRWFTSLVSKSEYLPPAKAKLRQLNATDVKEIEMQQGNKITRILAWTFMNAK